MKKFTNVQMYLVFVTCLVMLSLLLSGCATGPQTPYVPPAITINTIPPGADISVQGNYIGVSPVTITKPYVWMENDYRRWIEYGRADQPLQIQAQLKGYETKDVTFGVYHAPQDKIVQPIFSYSAVTTTTPGYYTFSDQITIKLTPK